MLRKTALSTAILFTLSMGAFAQNSSQKQVPMPDFSKWEKTADHYSVLSYKGENTKIRDEHYENVNNDRTEGSLVMVWYHPETSKTWFALYAQGQIKEGRFAPPMSVYLYEPGENGAWTFVQDVSDESVLLSALKYRYQLENPKE